jgi:hypothetical protein
MVHRTIRSSLLLVATGALVACAVATDPPADRENAGAASAAVTKAAAQGPTVSDLDAACTRVDPKTKKLTASKPAIKFLVRRGMLVTGLLPTLHLEVQPCEAVPGKNGTWTSSVMESDDRFCVDLWSGTGAPDHTALYNHALKSSYILTPDTAVHGDPFFSDCNAGGDLVPITEEELADAPACHTKNPPPWCPTIDLVLPCPSCVTGSARVSATSITAVVPEGPEPLTGAVVEVTKTNGDKQLVVFQFKGADQGATAVSVPLPAELKGNVQPQVVNFTAHGEFIPPPQQ